MAYSQHKGTNFKLEAAFASGDHIKNEIKTNINYDTRTSMESRLAGKGDGYETDLKTDTGSDITDNESAYEDSFCSDVTESDEESELTSITHRSSLDEIPKLKFTSSTSSTKQQETTNLNKKYASTSKICDTPFALEDRVKCLSLNEVRPVRRISVKPTRKNMSFSNDEVTKIERDNEILLRKIMTQQRPQKMKQESVQPKLSSSAINRKRFQKKIEEDNLLLLRRLQQAKPCIVNTPKLSGFRTTHL